ncbi:epimerase family protein SDR39U1 homolog, chloroplastic-like [Durio zibethinus]|uniref:Epimerase family protein SDR39U1 homolog, chloroplastic-like n=1 Tax=Durio zibethinus TaxID=66656 RepID=A0A6P6AE41_DURZI|nr:epimerase family protein SDR39U1 homolog, chloroplastic-like [Durio zibethinus]
MKMEVFCSHISLSWTRFISPSLHIPHSFSANQMTVSVTGATGFIGKRLVQRLHTVKDFPGIIIAEEAGWEGCIEGSNAVVNLAGMFISTRWSPEVGVGRSSILVFILCCQTDISF